MVSYARGWGQLNSHLVTACHSLSAAWLEMVSVSSPNQGEHQSDQEKDAPEGPSLTFIPPASNGQGVIQVDSIFIYIFFLNSDKRNA